MEPPNLEGITNILANISNWVDIIANVVNPIMGFMMPILLFLGEPLRNLILLVRDITTIGDYTTLRCVQMRRWRVGRALLPVFVATIRQ